MKNILQMQIHPVIFFTILIAAVIIMLKRFEQKALYFPEKKFISLPVFKYEDVSVISSDGIKLHGWYFEKDRDKPVLLFFHGNAGNISHRETKINYFLSLDLNILIFDYRGYGKSSGRPSEKGLYKDAAAFYGWLLENKNFSKDKIIFYGESLGGVVALQLALKNKPAALITESSFTSTKDMAKIYYPYLMPLFFIFTQKYDALSKIHELKSPLLIIHSTEDEIIPFKMAEKLFEFSPEPKRLLEIKGGHNDGFIVSNRKYLQGIKKFLEEFNLI